MQYATPGLTWTEWLEANDDRDDASKLAALREYIAATARREVRSCSYDAAWANKKLAKLGITDRIETEKSYTLSVPVTGVMELRMYGTRRAEALQKMRERLDGVSSGHVLKVTLAGEPTFLSGPEDPDPAAVDDDAPQTVDATLAKLREIIMLGHIAGPRICEEESNRVLADYGLAPIPPRKTFVIERPVTAVMRTTVEAYDEVSADRVAGWRWNNDRTGYEITETTFAGDPVVSDPDALAAAPAS